RPLEQARELAARGGALFPGGTWIADLRLEVAHAAEHFRRRRPARLVERGGSQRAQGQREQRRGPQAHARYPALRGGYFSPASIFVLRMFCFGGSGQVVNALNAQGGLYARFKSRSNVRFATGFGSMARKRPEPYVVLPAVSSLRIVKRPSSSSPTTSSLYVLPLSLNS